MRIILEDCEARLRPTFKNKPRGIQGWLSLSKISISVISNSGNLLNILINNFMKICNFTCSLLTLNNYLVLEEIKNLCSN